MSTSTLTLSVSWQYSQEDLFISAPSRVALSVTLYTDALAMRGHQHPAIEPICPFGYNSDNLPQRLCSLLAFTETVGPQLLHQINLLWHLCVMQNSVEWLSAQQDGRSFQAFNIELKTKTTHAHSYIAKLSFCAAFGGKFWSSFHAGANTWFGYKGRHSRTPLQPSVLLWAGWSGTSWECAYQCGRPYECTDPFHLVHLCKAYSQGSPHRYLPRNSLLCSFSVKIIQLKSVYVLCPHFSSCAARISNVIVCILIFIWP